MWPNFGKLIWIIEFWFGTNLEKNLSRLSTKILFFFYSKCIVDEREDLLNLSVVLYFITIKIKTKSCVMIFEAVIPVFLTWHRHSCTNSVSWRSKGFALKFSADFCPGPNESSSLVELGGPDIYGHYQSLSYKILQLDPDRDLGQAYNFQWSQIHFQSIHPQLKLKLVQLRWLHWSSDFANVLPINY